MNEYRAVIEEIRDATYTDDPEYVKTRTIRDICDRALAEPSEDEVIFDIDEGGEA